MSAPPLQRPGLVGASLQIVDLGWRQAVRSKMLIGVGIAILGAVALAFIASRESTGMSAAQVFQEMQMFIVGSFMVPLVALLLGTGAMASEREGGTLSFLFTRPIPRAAVVLGKGVSAILLANAAIVACDVLVWLATGAPANGQLVGGLMALLLETTGLTAVFVLFGTIVARSLYLGLAYAVFFEGIVGAGLGAGGGYTLSYHGRNLLSEWSGRSLDSAAALPATSFQSVVLLLVVSVGALGLACSWVERREYGLRDRPKEE